ncbi:hypothetical protein M0811_06082 [Anaeramoeba ignava]|uniref:Uncharacterized protein n=1 Tax=Anaeramoeba ignava TaxID=1746090 RepID=A0A9Q0LP57_ANAIG|nr:hypothetical protein M0811_06082 [Anaeramoeba ignava]
MISKLIKEKDLFSWFSKIVKKNVNEEIEDKKFENYLKIVLQKIIIEKEVLEKSENPFIFFKTICKEKGIPKNFFDLEKKEEILLILQELCEESKYQKRLCKPFSLAVDFINPDLEIISAGTILLRDNKIVIDTHLEIFTFDLKQKHTIKFHNQNPSIIKISFQKDCFNILFESKKEKSKFLNELENRIKIEEKQLKQQAHFKKIVECCQKESKKKKKNKIKKMKKRKKATNKSNGWLCGLHSLNKEEKLEKKKFEVSFQVKILDDNFRPIQDARLAF